jgi:type I restriction enzyme S subunit
LARALERPVVEAQLKKLTNTSAQSGVYLGKLKTLPIPLPSAEEQKRIAAILDKADAIRRKRQQAIALSEDLRRSVFLEMFGDPVTNPQGWQETTLGQLLIFLTSGSRGWARYYAKTGNAFLRIQNVGRNQLLLDDLAFVNAPADAEARRTAVQAGDVLLSITADLGRTAVIPEDFGPANINQHLAILRAEGIRPLYLSQYLASAGGQTQIARLDRQGVKSGLNFADIRSLKIFTPPIPQQLRFEAAWRAIQQLNSRQQVSLTASDDLFASLSQRAFRGEL